MDAKILHSSLKRTTYVVKDDRVAHSLIMTISTMMMKEDRNATAPWRTNMSFPYSNLTQVHLSLRLEQ